MLSDSFKNKHSKFINGGKFTSDIKEYLSPGYQTTLNDNNYVVTSSTMKSVFLEKNSTTSSKAASLIITFVILITLSLITYLNRNKILEFIKR